MQPAADVASDLAPTEVFSPAASETEGGAPSALDALFSDENFHDYTAEPVLARPAPAQPAKATESAPRQPGEIGRSQKVLLAVAGGLVVVLALVALFLVGTRLPTLLGSASAPLTDVVTEPTPGPTDAADEVPLPTGPVEPGVWAWNELRGGECLDGYSDPWAEEFTVVDCATPHAAQLVVRAEVPVATPEASDEAFPGVEVLRERVSELCAAPGVLDLSQAGDYTDVQLEVSYPAVAEQWNTGERTYFCFVNRASGEPIEGSLAVIAADDAD